MILLQGVVHSWARSSLADPHKQAQNQLRFQGLRPVGTLSESFEKDCKINRYDIMINSDTLPI